MVPRRLLLLSSGLARLREGLSRVDIYTLRTQKGGDVDKKVPRESAREKKIVATT